MSSILKPDSSRTTPQVKLLSRPGRLEQPLLPARFHRRLHRFALEISLESQPAERCVAHMADPGRLTHLLHPGRKLWVEGPFSGRKTNYSAILAELESGVCVSLVTTLANTVFPQLLENQLLSQWQDSSESTWSWKREVRRGSSRFDYLLTKDAREWWVECKSVTWQEGGTGWFPDAPTKRGTRHLQELTEMAREGLSTAAVFVAQREDIVRISPAAQIDIAFADALKAAWSCGVALIGVGVTVRPDGVWFARELPVVWYRDKVGPPTEKP